MMQQSNVSTIAPSVAGSVCVYCTSFIVLLLLQVLYSIWLSCLA